jgi:hypothetical protein
LKNLLDNASENNDVKRVIADGKYDDSKVRKNSTFVTNQSIGCCRRMQQQKNF